MLGSDELRRPWARRSKLAFALGQDVAGQPFSADLAEMPHVLIAGATGSGKSVCVNAIICSLLMRATPTEVKLILIDPKRVEMAQYKGIPHLLTEVIVDSDKAVERPEVDGRHHGGPLPRVRAARRAQHRRLQRRAAGRASRGCRTS